HGKYELRGMRKPQAEECRAHRGTGRDSVVDHDGSPPADAQRRPPAPIEPPPPLDLGELPVAFVLEIAGRDLRYGRDLIVHDDLWIGDADHRSERQFFVSGDAD